MGQSINSHQDLKKLILSELDKDVWKPGERIPSERQLAETYGVSRAVVRRALGELIDKGILTSAPGSGTFVSIERHQKDVTRTLAFLVCTRGKPHYTVTTNLFYAQVLRGIELEARRLGYQCVVSTIDELDFENGYLDEIIDKVDGLILGELRCVKMHDYLRKAGVPTVLISPSLDSSEFDTIKMDNLPGSLLAIDHLVSLGHRRIAFLGGSRNSSPARERLQGYHLGLDKHGIERDPRLERIAGWDFEPARDATKELLDEEDFTALFAASDILAIAAIQAIKERNLSVPEDISVIGFDDLETSAQHTPQLTAIHVYKEYMGQLAVTLLLSRLKDSRDFGTTTIVPTKLVQRASTSPVCQSAGNKAVRTV